MQSRLPVAGLALLVTALCAAPLPGAEQAGDAVSRLPRDDVQLWSEFQYDFPVAGGVDAALSGTFRLGRDLSHPVNERAGVAVSFKAGKYLTLTPGYAYIAFQPLPGRDTRENRLYLDVTLKRAVGNFLLSDRSRVERRFVTPLDYFRYRNRFQVEHPLELGHLGLRLWVSDEIFYDGLLKAWSRNRIAAGVTRRMSHVLSMDFYYCRQNDHFSHPGDIHAIGVGFKFRQ